MNIEVNFESILKDTFYLSFKGISFIFPCIPTLLNKFSSEDNTHIAHIMAKSCLESTALFPKIDQIALRKKAATLMTLEVVTGATNVSNITIDTETSRILLDEPSLTIDELCKIIAKLSRRGIISGFTLHYLHEMEEAYRKNLTDHEPSINSAIFFAQEKIKDEQLDTSEDRKKYPENYKNIWKYWNQYKPVSHLWLAEYILREEIKHHTGYSTYNFPFSGLMHKGNYLKFLKISEYYRLFGETFQFRRRNSYSQKNYFAQGEAWRHSPELDLSGISLIDNEKNYSDLLGLIERWNNRQST